jgi:uncharacterized protein YdeI (BOF family)
MSETGSGFTGEDRKTLITVEVQMGNIMQALSSLSGRTAVLEKEHVTRDEFRAAEIDIDDLRVNKANVTDVKALSIGKADKDETLLLEVKKLREQIEELQRWRWFERGVVATIISLGEFIMHKIFK